MKEFFDELIKIVRGSIILIGFSIFTIIIYTTAGNREGVTISKQELLKNLIIQSYDSKNVYVYVKM